MSLILKNKKIYFASDFHLGDNSASAKEREKTIVKWLDEISVDAGVLYLVGDIFDFWFEYKTVVPKGYVRFLGKLAEMIDNGIEIHIFTGNHDVWMFTYFEEELGAIVHRKPIEVVWNKKLFFIGHGDGLGPGDHGYKVLKKLFTNRVAQWLFARLHPNFAIGLMQYFSNLSRQDTQHYTFKGIDKEWLVQFSLEQLKTKPDIDFFVFGHRHVDVDVDLPNTKSRYINLGEWMYRQSYAVFDGQTLELNKYLK